MTHSWENPSLPLTDAERQMPLSGILPSGEGNFFDGRTNIDANFNDEITGIIATSGAAASGYSTSSGIFGYDGLKGQFTGGAEVPLGFQERLKPFKRPPLTTASNRANDREPTDFRVQDSYIHHTPLNNEKVEILFLSSYGVDIQYDRYGSFDSYFNSEFGLNEEEE